MTSLDEGYTYTQTDGAFSFATYAGSCYRVYFLKGASLEVSIGGLTAVHYVYLEASDTNIDLQLTTSPVSVSVGIPGWTPSNGGSLIMFFIKVVVDIGNGVSYTYWDETTWSSVSAAGQLAVDLLPGQIYTALIGADDHYYEQFAGGADVWDRWGDPPADVQTLMVSADGSPASWSPAFNMGSTVTGTVSLDGEQASDVTVGLMRPYSNGLLTLINRVTVTANGSFSIGGLAPGGTYTLTVTSKSHQQTWLGGVTGESPSWDQLKGSAFTAAASGGTVTGKNITLVEDAEPDGNSPKPGPGSSPPKPNPGSSSPKPGPGSASPEPTVTAPVPGAVAPPAVALTLDTGGSAPKVGRLVSAPAVPAGWTATYQWMSNGQPVPGATGRAYKPTSWDAGKRLQVRVTLTRSGAKASIVTTKPVTVAKIIPTVKTRLLKSGKLRVTVKAKGIPKPTGKVTVKFGKVSKTYKLKAKAKGKLTIIVPEKVKPGKIKVKVTFKGNGQIAKKTAKTIKITVRE